MVSMPENSTIPALIICSQRMLWLYFCMVDDGDKFISGADYQNADTVKEIFQSDFCITLDELPNLYGDGTECYRPVNRRRHRMGRR